jgi:hypothetical protein
MQICSEVKGEKRESSMKEKKNVVQSLSDSWYMISHMQEKD